MKHKILFCLLFCVCFAILPLATWAAVLYLTPKTGQYQPGDTFLVEIRIDTEEECINAVEANLSYDKDVLEATDFSRGKSVLTLWVKSPTIDENSGLISFTGGVPGGYCGRVPGDPGESNLLGKIIFRVPGMRVVEQEKDLAEIKFLENCQVFLNDGLGTRAKLTTQGATFKILPKAEPPKDEWKEELKKDDIPPELFQIEINQEPSVFQDKYFITFSTTDKQTGLDYYEIKEGELDWRKAESPYLLEDQGLRSIIKVKAVDKAGNIRIAEYIPEIPKKPFPYLEIILILIGIGIIWWIIRKIQITKSK